MSKKRVSANELHDKWMKQPKYRNAYDGLEEEFLPLAPNKETIAAIKQARRGGLKSYRTTKALLKSLNTNG